MPHHKSCKKRLKTSQKARIANRGYRTHLRHNLKEFRLLSDPTQAATRLPGLSGQLDRMVKKGIIKRNMADRLKSRLALHANQLSQS